MLRVLQFDGPGYMEFVQDRWPAHVFQKVGASR